MFNGQRVSVVFPAYNEEENIARAVADFSLEVVDEIVVVDNNSRDRTAEEVRRTRARLVTEHRQGYGYALRRGLAEATGDLIVLAEPDGTFQGKDVLKLLAYADECDVVFGTRTTPGFIHPDANMGPLLRWGNWAAGKLLQILFSGPSLSDVGCTMRLIRREMLRQIEPRFTSGGATFSPEMMLLAISAGARAVEVPLSYGRRVGTSKITGDLRRAVRVGWQMLLLMLAWRVRLWREGGWRQASPGPLTDRTSP